MAAPVGGRRGQEGQSDNRGHQCYDCGYPVPPALPSGPCCAMVVAGWRLCRNSSQAVYEVPSLAAWAPLDDGDVFPLKPGHGQAPLKSPLNLTPVCPMGYDEPHAQGASAILHELKIPYLIPERSVDPEHIRPKRSPPP